MKQRSIGDDEIYDYLDIDCEDCGQKFYVRPLSREELNQGKTYKTRCTKCEQAKRAFELDMESDRR